MKKHNQWPQLLKMTGIAMEKIWGGSFLAKQRNFTKKNMSIGEIWELSTLPEGPSLYFPSSSTHSLSLPEYIGNHPADLEYFWGSEKNLNYLIKFIDTSDYLSVQVHPDDSFAKVHENSSGKTECWIILDAIPEAGVYLGLKKGTKKEEFFAKIENYQDITADLNFFPVSRGDFFYVPAGTVHSIGRGVCLLEIQQSCGLTYRIWDWNRSDQQGKSRELHLQKAMKVLRFEDEFNTPEYFQIKKNVFQQETLELIQHPQFQVSIGTLSLGSRLHLNLSQKGGRSKAIVCTEGNLEVQRGEEKILLKSFETVLIPFQGEDHLTLLNHSSTSALARYVLVS